MSATTDIVLDSGRIRGLDKDGVRVWRGIPYAAPPVGSLRFQPPQPVERWAGVRDCYSYGAPAPQVASTAFGPAAPGPAPSEDCLYLNITAPAQLSPDGAPVVVWFHGGGLSNGEGPELVGDMVEYARAHGIVCVTLNYRLNAVGFLHLGDHLGADYADSGCLGLLDQQAALRWVARNVAAFGGDPHRVTIAGVSAGARCVAAMMSWESSRGLFSQGISQSGGGDLVARPDAARRVTDLVLSRLGISAEQLLSHDVMEIVRASLQILGPTRSTWLWRPTQGQLKTAPIEQIEQGSARRVPLLIGNNANEAATFSMLDPTCVARAPVVLRQAFGDERAAAILEDYASRRSSSDEVNRSLMSDERYVVSTLRVATAQSQYAPTFRYVFDAPVTGLPDSVHGGHGMELFHLFGGAMGLEPADACVAQAMRSAWAAFITTGDPSTDALPWPQFRADTAQTMMLGNAVQVESAPRAQDMAAWGDARWTFGYWFDLPDE
jgi:para-nitrobenzyl esterase